MSASGMMTAPPDGFRIGNVLSRSFGVLSRNIVPFVILAAIVQLPNLVLVLYGWGTSMHRPTPSSITSMAAVAGLVAFFVLPISQAVINYAAFQDMRGRPIDIGESFGRGIARFFPIIGTWICMGVLMIVGFFLLVVPGIMIAVALSVAIQVCVVERRGPFASIGRSRFLTKGNRWGIFGLSLLLFVIGAIIGGAFWIVRVAAGPEVAAVVNFILQSAFSAFHSVVFVVAYHDLRVEKEGLDTDRIAAVFD